MNRLRPRGLKTQKGRHTGEVRAGRRSRPDNGFAQLLEWTDGGSALASPCGRTGQTPRQRIQHSRRTYDFPDDFPERLVRFREVSRMPWAEIARRLGAGPKTAGWCHKDGVRPNPRARPSTRPCSSRRRPWRKRRGRPRAGWTRSCGRSWRPRAVSLIRTLLDGC